MTIAAAIESRTAEAPARSKISRIARVDIISDLSKAEPIWRELETQQLATPYQRFDLLAAWQREVGTRENAQPFVVIAHDADGRPLHDAGQAMLDAVQRRNFVGLLPGIELSPGRITVTFETTEEALEKLLALALAIGQNQEEFEQRVGQT